MAQGQVFKTFSRKEKTKKKVNKSDSFSEYWDYGDLVAVM